MHTLGDASFLKWPTSPAQLKFSCAHEKFLIKVQRSCHKKNYLSEMFGFPEIADKVLIKNKEDEERPRHKVNSLSIN